MGLLNIAIALDSILTLQGVLIQKIHGFFLSNHAILLIWKQFQTGNFLRASQETSWFSNYVINTPLVAPMTSVVAWISIFVAGRHCCCLWNAMLVAWLILSSSELTHVGWSQKKTKIWWKNTKSTLVNHPFLLVNHILFAGTETQHVGLSDHRYTLGIPQIRWLTIVFPIAITWGLYPFQTDHSSFIQWEFQDPKMEVLYHIRPYFGGISPYIGLT